MNETREIQNYLERNGDPTDLLLTEVKLLLNPQLNETMNWQILAHQAIQTYGQKELRQEIQRAEKRLFTETRFRIFKNNILNIFKK